MEQFWKTRDKFTLSNFGNPFKRGDENRLPRRVIITAENKLLVFQAMHDYFGHCGIGRCSQRLREQILAGRYGS
ncbi:hypothetical protein V1517DRAFT_66739 [Lipomyces orientalis]|uniref:Uncharacterized protein n=1 Tax=Lipomyces orientalis TaxID=1233043 RepID=A0ACC3TD71_9ASCO